MTIPIVLSAALEKIEPGASFKGTPPKLTSSTSHKSYYAKTGSASEAEQFLGEAESLRILEKCSPGFGPKVFAVHSDDDGDQPSGTSTTKPYMISEYLEFSGGLTSASEEELARRLATEVHAHMSENSKFGFAVPTYCGVTRFENGWYETWAECFGEMIKSMLDRIEAKGGRNLTQLVEVGREVQSRVIPFLLNPERLEVSPSFLHGDLWSGNVGTTSSGSPVIYDLASYFGHSEADLAIARIFGGFSSDFFTAYHEHRPKSEPVEEYDRRVELYELFHYLNHALIFGSTYAAPALSRMKSLLIYAEKNGL